MSREEGQPPFLAVELTGGLGAMDTADDSMAILLTERPPLAGSSRASRKGQTAERVCYRAMLDQGFCENHQMLHAPTQWIATVAQ